MLSGTTINSYLLLTCKVQAGGVNVEAQPSASLSGSCNRTEATTTTYCSRTPNEDDITLFKWTLLVPFQEVHCHACAESVCCFDSKGSVKYRVVFALIREDLPNAYAPVNQSNLLPLE